MKLSTNLIKGFQPEAKRAEYFDDVETGLHIIVFPTGKKTFYYRYRFSGKNRRFKIGEFPAISLADARAKVRELKIKVMRGEDPQGDRQAKRNKPKEVTFADLAERYKRQHLPKLAEKTQREETYRMDNILLPALGKYALKDISKSMLIKLLEDIAYKQKAPYQSNRIRARLSHMFNFAADRELIEHSPMLGVPKMGKEQRRERVLTEDEIQALWHGAEELGTPKEQLIKMLLLLGQRKGETSRMRWQDINGDVWTIPAAETKAGRQHSVPLPPLALQILETLPKHSEYVFSFSQVPYSEIHSDVKMITRDLGNIRTHDLRRTAATYMAGLGVDQTTLGKLLNHAGLSGANQVTAIYNRYDYMSEKRTALNRWSHELQRIVSGATEGAKILKM